MHPPLLLVLLTRAPKDEVSTGEIIQGIAVLAVFLAVAYAHMTPKVAHKYSTPRNGNVFRAATHCSHWLPSMAPSTSADTTGTRRV